MRIFVITGAGISAESGIPTFRGKDGYWRTRQSGSDLDPAKLATPEAFARDPKLVWEWYRERRKRIRLAEPNAAHKAMADLARHARGFLVVTQNVDDLHARAGLPSHKMVQIHGDIFVTRCAHCGFGHQDEEKVGKDILDLGVRRPVGAFKSRTRPRTPKPEHDYETEEEEIPKCSRCGASMRPGVVWFGEQLDPRKIDIVESFLARGPVDLTLVIGTTALFGYIIDWALRARGTSGELIEINPAATPISAYATTVIREPAAIALPEFIHQRFTLRPRSESQSREQERTT
jgi:NAD-dependent deacetylase